jgi:cytochrome c-type biogenesis protein
MLFKIGDNVRVKAVALIFVIVLIILTTSCSCTGDEGRHTEPDKGPTGVEEGDGGDDREEDGTGDDKKEGAGRDDRKKDGIGNGKGQGPADEGKGEEAAEDGKGRDGAGDGDLDRLLEEMLDIETVDFTLKDLKGEKISLFGLRGRIVMLNFWATWCSSCLMGMPDIQAVYEEYKDSEDLAILAVNLTISEDRSIPSQYRDELDSGQWVKKFIEDEGYTFPVLLDHEGEAAYKYGIWSVPTTFFIDRDGIIRYVHPGPMTRDDIMYYFNNIKRLDER